MAAGKTVTRGHSEIIQHINLRRRGNGGKKAAGGGQGSPGAKTHGGKKRKGPQTFGHISRKESRGRKKTHTHGPA